MACQRQIRLKRHTYFFFITHRIHVWYNIYLVDLCGFHVGKYTIIHGSYGSNLQKKHEKHGGFIKVTRNLGIYKGPFGNFPPVSWGHFFFKGTIQGCRFGETTPKKLDPAVRWYPHLWRIGSLFPNMFI